MRPIALALLLVAAPACATDWSAWQRSYDAATRTRFIPVELWTGAPWDGTQEIRMAPAPGRRAEKNIITGPMVWNGIEVYEKLSRGDILQRFALRDDRTGLGRVSDSRSRTFACRGEVKFPLGRWKQGEVREYDLPCDRGRTLPLKVTIEEIDFVHDGAPHSLRFHWLLNNGSGRGTDMRYVYSPLRGLVHVAGNE
jgi:hypothetical protein